MSWCYVRNETQTLLLTVLLTVAGAAQSEAESWFPTSPCGVDPPQVVALPGARLLLAVHYQPDAPPHDVIVERGTDTLWRVSLEEWTQWTPLSMPVETGPDGERRVLLKPGPALAMRLDACTSELWVDANPQRQHTADMNRPPPHPVARAGYGGFLNLDAAYGGLAGRNVVNSLFDLGAFVPGGAGRSGFFVGSNAVRRLDTSWIHDEPGSAIRVRLGDSITRNADWESAVRFGGVQWGTDFSLQPDRITFPLPAIGGSAALASTAQLYVNGVQQSQQTVQPGQFRFDSVPALTGAGELSVVIRDNLGRMQTVTQPFYASPRLLTAGLEADTFEAGFLRTAYASADDRYSQPFAAATLQRGYTEILTGLLRGSADRRRQLAGVEGDYIRSPFGVFTLSGAVVHTEAGGGGVGTLAFERQANDLSVSIRRRVATREYGDLGREPGTLHFSDAARVSLNLHLAGIASIVYISEQPWRSSGEGAGIRLAGLAWNLQLRGSLSAYASWLHPLVGGSGDNIVIGLSITLGQGTSLGLQSTRDGRSEGASVAVQHSPAATLGWAYSASADGRDGGLRQAQAALTTDRGTIGAGWAGFGGNGSPSAAVQTSLAFLDGHGYWTRPVQNSFAVVDTGNAPGVRVYRENQLVGTTDTHGRLLVPDLLPFSVNRLSIDDSDLPVATGLAAVAEQIAPPANAGVPVHFKVDARSSVRVRLVDSDGSVVLVGTALWLDGHSLPLPVGYDGLVYADIPDGTHLLEARWADGQCRARLEVTGTQAKAESCRRVAQ
jgi:outer membrane usher protein